MTRAQELAIWMVGLALAVVAAVHGSETEEEWIFEVVAPLVIVGGLVVFSLRRGGLGHDPRVVRAARLALRVVHGLLTLLGVAAAGFWVVSEVHDRRVVAEDFACWDGLRSPEQQTFRDLSIHGYDWKSTWREVEEALRTQPAAKCHLRIWKYGTKSERAWNHGELSRSYGGDDLTFAAIAATPLALWALRRLLSKLGSPPAPPPSAGGVLPGPSARPGPRPPPPA